MSQTIVGGYGLVTSEAGVSSFGRCFDCSNVTSVCSKRLESGAESSFHWMSTSGHPDEQSSASRAAASFGIGFCARFAEPPSTASFHVERTANGSEHVSLLFG